MWKNVLDRHLSRKLINDPVKICSHYETEMYEDQKICVECGEIIEKNFLINQFNVTGTIRKTSSNIVSSIYACIPTDLVEDNEIKNTAVKIYKIISVKRQYRSTFRKAIIAACVHRASILCNGELSVSECASSFRIKSSSEMGKAIGFVTENLPYGEYEIPNKLYAIHDLGPILNGLKNYTTKNLEILIYNFKRKLESESFFHKRSGLCACVWFIVSTFAENKISLRDFTREYNDFCDKETIFKKTTTSTIRKRYLEIKRFTYRRCLKYVFADYLYEKLKVIEVITEEDIKASNLHDPREMTIISIKDGFVYPIDDVDDITDWNILFRKNWNGIVIPFFVVDSGTKIQIRGETDMNRQIKRFSAENA